MSDDGTLLLSSILYTLRWLDGELWPRAGEACRGHGTCSPSSRPWTIDKQLRFHLARTIAELDASYKNYWAFHILFGPKPSSAVGPSVVVRFPHDAAGFRQNSHFQRMVETSGLRPCDAWRQLMVEDQVSSLICVVNARGHDAPTSEQSRIFKLAVHHIDRALRPPPPALDARSYARRDAGTVRRLTPRSDSGRRRSKCAFHQRCGRGRCSRRDGLVLKGGCLATTDGADTLKRLIASCARAAGGYKGRSAENSRCGVVRGVRLSGWW